MNSNCLDINNDMFLFKLMYIPHIILYEKNLIGWSLYKAGTTSYTNKLLFISWLLIEHGTCEGQYIIELIISEGDSYYLYLLNGELFIELNTSIFFLCRNTAEFYRAVQTRNWPKWHSSVDWQKLKMVFLIIIHQIWFLVMEKQEV